MYQRVLLALDLEGVNCVVGEPYRGLARDTEQWEIARKQGVQEINAAAEALFDAGVMRVALWDNHGGKSNVDPSALDERIELLSPDPKAPRMSFAAGEFDCICFFGYHAMEGTLGGVLAHTMNSAAIQFYKLNGSYIGEVDMDAYIAAAHGMPAVFFAGGNIACQQAKRAVDTFITVETKQELERNQAIFRNNEELFAEIKTKIVESVSREVNFHELHFPATVEKSFKRTEDAAKCLLKLEQLGISATHPEEAVLGRDGHTVKATVYNIDQFIMCI